jgi:hypothetical protein
MEQAMTHSGDCRGGPYDGKKLTHWGLTKRLFKTAKSLAPRALSVVNPEEEVEIDVEGEYVWTNAYWLWVPTSQKSSGR